MVPHLSFTWHSVCKNFVLLLFIWRKLTFVSTVNISWLLKQILYGAGRNSFNGDCDDNEDDVDVVPGFGAV
jgi:hypothetical protein